MTAFSYNVLHNTNGDPVPIELGEEILRTVLDAGPVLDALILELCQEDDRFPNLSTFFQAVRHYFAHLLPEKIEHDYFGQPIDPIIVQSQRWMTFENEFSRDVHRLIVAEGQHQNAIYFPNPTHEHHPESLFNIQPFVQRHPIITKSTPIASAGSCFAIEISQHLQASGFNYVVAEREPFWRAISKYPESSAAWGRIFNTPSFRQLADKAAGKIKLPDYEIYNINNECWEEPFRESVFYKSKKDLIDSRVPHNVACRQVFKKADVMIITLGLNEAWQHKRTGYFASNNPTFASYYALFRHRVLSYQENLDALNNMIDTLRSINPALKFIVSVSPIPFLATGLSDHTHVVVANSRSKAMLQTVAEEFVRTHDGVYYFPSYEMVTNCIENPWAADQRHVKPEAVAKVMQMFEEMFVAD